MKTALVTGGNRGIGFEICKALSSKGYLVIMGSRDLVKGREAASKIGANVIAFELDLADSNVLASQLSAMKEFRDNVDIVVNNAGVLVEGELLKLSPREVGLAMQVNCMSAIQVSKAFLPNMNKRKSGRIVNVSSGWGAISDGLTGPAAYSLSKSALNAATIILSNEAKSGVYVNAVCPGWVRTAMGGNFATRSAQKGAETPVWLATEESITANGKFFRDKQEIYW